MSNSSSIESGFPPGTPVVQLEKVTVRYRVPHEQIATLKEYAIRVLQRRVRHEDFFALQDVSLEIEKGAVVGIIGRNGAGKTTMLKLVARVLRPTRGRVRVVGRVAPLLELQAGFHHELTGRENVFLNGTLLGFSREEVSRLLDEILDFSELEDFIDAPLRTYSSGMIVRLGFAVATSIRPDILLVDEVLSVGDERFQKKCVARIEAFCAQGTTILFVTHNTSLARAMCDRGIWLDHGLIRAQGLIDEVISQYHLDP